MEHHFTKKHDLVWFRACSKTLAGYKVVFWAARSGSKISKYLRVFFAFLTVRSPQKTTSRFDNRFLTSSSLISNPQPSWVTKRVEVPKSVLGYFSNVSRPGMKNRCLKRLKTNLLFKSLS